jgi:hypothetical protein
MPALPTVRRALLLLLGAILGVTVGASIYVAVGGQPPAAALAGLAAAEAAISFLHEVIGPDQSVADDKSRREASGKRPGSSDRM